MWLFRRIFREVTHNSQLVLRSFRNFLSKALSLNLPSKYCEFHQRPLSNGSRSYVLDLSGKSIYGYPWKIRLNSPNHIWFLQVLRVPVVTASKFVANSGRRTDSNRNNGCINLLNCLAILLRKQDKNFPKFSFFTHGFFPRKPLVHVFTWLHLLVTVISGNMKTSENMPLQAWTCVNSCC